MPRINEGEVGLIGYRNEAGEFVSEPFDPENPKHLAVLEIFACSCPECKAILEEANGGERRRTLN